jgi:predicted nucleotidyltransferase
MPRSNGSALPLFGLIDRASSVFESDPRIDAAWLEGSFAAGTHDAWSDVDFYVAIPDDAFDAVLQDRHDLIGKVGDIIGYGENPVPGGFLVFANLEGLLRLDVVFAKTGDLGGVSRRHVRVLFDRAGITDRLIEATAEPDLVNRVETLVREFFYGSFQAKRLAGRKEWRSLQMGFYMEMFFHVVPAWLAVDVPAEAFRPGLHNERFLSEARRSQMQSLLGRVERVFRSGEPAPDELKHLLESFYVLVFHALRQACERWHVTYPEASERLVREAYKDSLGLEIP